MSPFRRKLAPLAALGVAGCAVVGGASAATASAQLLAPVALVSLQAGIPAAPGLDSPLDLSSGVAIEDGPLSVGVDVPSLPGAQVGAHADIPIVGPIDIETPDVGLPVDLGPSAPAGPPSAAASPGASPGAGPLSAPSASAPPRAADPGPPRDIPAAAVSSGSSVVHGLASDSATSAARAPAPSPPPASRAARATPARDSLGSPAATITPSRASPQTSLRERALGIATTAGRSLWLPLALVIALLGYLVSQRQFDRGAKLAASGRSGPPDDEIIEL